MAKLYGSVGDKTKTITKVYGSSPILLSATVSNYSGSGGAIRSVNPGGFVARLKTQYPSYLWRTKGLLTGAIVSGSNNQYTLNIYFNGTPKITVSSLPQSGLEAWGFTLGSPYFQAVSFASTYSPASREITKIYGSEGGVAKRIF